ncbi:MAG TPA: hypothetical protein O0X32_02420 [Methanocorpusculum sp.]|nr:hypothetical protein [Methanocorpusculum sp.]
MDSEVFWNILFVAVAATICFLFLRAVIKAFRDRNCHCNQSGNCSCCHQHKK